MRLSYVNGRYVSHGEAAVHIEDRGYQLADGVYEVMAFYNRRFLDEDAHLRRLQRSLKELSMAMPVTLAALKIIIREVVDRNNRDNGTLYLQISRGVAPRDHVFPKNVKSSLVVTVNPIRPPKKEDVEKGISVITHPEQRWARRDIKSIALLANVLAKQAAYDKKAKEALLVDDKGVVAEGSSTNFYIVNAKGELVTHPFGSTILGGVTREDVVQVAKKNKVKLVERPITLKEALAAREAFITSTSINVLPVVKIDDKKIGAGTPGKVTMGLLNTYLDHVERQTGYRP